MNPLGAANPNETREPAKLLKADGSVVPVFPKNGKTFGLDELQAMVGGSIQIVNPPSKHGALLILHEDGKLLGLPRNDLATKVYSDPGGIGDYISGDALLCHRDQVD